MADYLLNLGSKPIAKKLVRQLKLPISLPESLPRVKGPCVDTPLAGMDLALGQVKDSRLGKALKSLLTTAGARVLDAAAANGDATARLNGIVLDASGLLHTSDLHGVYEFLQPRVGRLATGAKVVLIGNDPSKLQSATSAATHEALIGLVKSLAKELGRKGATCQALLLDPKAESEDYLDAPLRFLLSGRSAFISGQTLTLTASSEIPSVLPKTQLLSGKIALVTGAAQGIGAEICRRLAAEGAKVLGLDRPAEEANLTTLMSEIDGTALAFDLLEAGTPKAVAAKIEAECGHLDILINNAGITRDKTLARMPVEWWDDVIALNLTAAIRLTEVFVHGEGEMFKLMNPGGRVVFLSSIGGIAGNAGQTNYAAAKSGLIGYVRALAPQTARRGITVNALAPGFIETRMTAAMPIAVREVARRFNSLNQAGLPSDVADAAAFLASPGAFGITGSVLRVCGQNLIGA